MWPLQSAILNGLMGKCDGSSPLTRNNDHHWPCHVLRALRAVLMGPPSTSFLTPCPCWCCPSSGTTASGLGSNGQSPWGSRQSRVMPWRGLSVPLGEVVMPIIAHCPAPHISPKVREETQGPEPGTLWAMWDPGSQAWPCLGTLAACATKEVSTGQGWSLTRGAARPARTCWCNGRGSEGQTSQM